MRRWAENWFFEYWCNGQQWFDESDIQTYEIEDDDYEEFMEFMEDTCPTANYWVHSVPYESISLISVRFQDDVEAVAFKLRWA